MEMKLHTYNIQEMMIALIDYKIKLKYDETPKKLAEERIERAKESLDFLTTLNNGCSEDNDYTVTVTIGEGK